jgi:plastocyanin
MENPEAEKVTLKDFAFHPMELVVPPGSTVTWVNEDPVEHTVVNLPDGAVFRSSGLKQGDTFTFTFDGPGEYDYYCSIHPSMRGKIIIKQ